MPPKFRMNPRKYRKAAYGGFIRRKRLGFLGGIRRRRLAFNPMPSFTETYNGPQIVANAGGQFTARISDIPQIADYQALYNQYRINWIKVIVIPDFGVGDPNTYNQNFVGGVPAVANSRIAWAINDTPALANPVNEAEVLTDNGAKIRTLQSKWSCSFKPRPDKFTGDAAGGPGVAVREKFSQWLSFADPVVPANNPIHRGVSYWISALAAGGGTQAYNVYYKVNFSLRDPK